MTPEEEAFGPNVALILKGGTRVVRGRIPAAVRSELAAAVKAGVIGRLKRDGLAPEVYFHPDHLHLARDQQRKEALYGIDCIARVMAPGDEVRSAIEAVGGDVAAYALGK